MRGVHSHGEIVVFHEPLVHLLVDPVVAAGDRVLLGTVGVDQTVHEHADDAAGHLHLLVSDDPVDVLRAGGLGLRPGVDVVVERGGCARVFLLVEQEVQRVQFLSDHVLADVLFGVRQVHDVQFLEHVLGHSGGRFVQERQVGRPFGGPADGAVQHLHLQVHGFGLVEMLSRGVDLDLVGLELVHFLSRRHGDLAERFPGFGPQSENAAVLDRLDFVGLQIVVLEFYGFLRVF